MLNCIQCRIFKRYINQKNNLDNCSVINNIHISISTILKPFCWGKGVLPFKPYHYSRTVQEVDQADRLDIGLTETFQHNTDCQWRVIDFEKMW